MGRTQGGDPAANPTPSEEQELPFETAMERLEAVVDRLERGELDLEAALASFEEGVGLSRRCASQLEAAERRIEVLTQEGGRLLARPLDDLEELGDDDESGDSN